MKVMFRSRFSNKRFYIFSIAFLVAVLIGTFAVLARSKSADAGADPPPSCSISFVRQIGTAAVFKIDISPIDGFTVGVFRYPYGATGSLDWIAADPIPEGYHTYYFPYGSTYTVRGGVMSGGHEGGTGTIVANCSRSYTSVNPVNSACTGYSVNTPSITPGSSFQVSISVQNTGTTTWNFPTWVLGADATYAGTSNYLGYTRAENNPGSIPPGATATYVINRTAPGAAGTYNYQWRMVHEGVEWFGPVCPGTITVVSPPTPPTCSLSVNPSLVAPGGSSTLSWSTTNTTSFSVNQGVGALSPVAGGTRSVSPGNTSKTYTGTATGPGGTVNCATTLNVGTIGCSINSILAIEPGQTYSPSVTISYVGGAVSVTATTTVTANSATSTAVTPATAFPGNTSITVSPAPPILFATVGNYPVSGSVSGTVNGVAFGPIACTGATNIPVVLKPYFKVFNGGVTVGAGFNNGTTTCTAVGTGVVSSFASDTPNFHGASTQYDLRALSSVATTFYSSGQRPTALPNYKALTLANNAASGTYGGNFGGTSCITDYYATTQNASVPTTSGGSTIASLDTAAGTGNQVEWGGGMLSGGNLAAGGKLVVYVTGDVYISANITTASNYTSLTDIPFFALVVKGNIKIAPGVTQLDGLYVAQPNGATGGNIYTCLNADNTVPNLYTSCRTKLTFNGSVVAKSIKLLRTNGTLANGPANETAASVNIAEVFNGTPEMYISYPAFRVDDSMTELYDSVTSLPPLL